MSNLPILAKDGAVHIVDPRTGEAVALGDAEMDQLAACRAWIRTLEETCRDAKQVLDAEVVERLDRQAKWSWSGSGYTLKAPSPEPQTVYDGEALWESLARLAAKGVISWEAQAEAVARVWDYKPRVAGINRLHKLGGDVAEAIDACATAVERARRVTLGRDT